MEKLKQCPLCNSGHFTTFITCKDYTVSKEEFSIVGCQNCNFLFTNPRPTEVDLPRYYESEDYISHQNKSNSITNVVYKLARKFTIKRKVSLINSMSHKARLLDIGCGTGHFLKACQNSGWETQGVEPDSTARAIAQNQIQNSIYESIETVTQNNFNVITLWHVLEHVPDLNGFMKKLTKLLAPDGLLIIAVPNHTSYDAQIYKEYWAAYDVPRHLYHFDQNTMESLSTKFKLSIKQILPMKLDAFYVSLLSESNRGSNPAKFFKAIVNGCKSNIYAKNHQNNYSSLIYLISSENE